MSYDGERVDFLDGVVFEPDEAYLTLGRWTDDVAESGVLAAERLHRPARLLPVAARAVSRDVLTAYDYLWRWDTDWFWCSRAFGAQHPVARRVWPRRWRRSDVYYKIVGLENRFQVKAADRPRGAASPTTSASSRTSRCRWSAPPTSCAGSPSTCRCARCGCARCGCATSDGPGSARTLAAVPAEEGHHLRQRRLLGHRADRARPRRRRRQQGHRAGGGGPRRAQVACTPTRTTTRRRSPASTAERRTRRRRGTTTPITG